MASAIPLSMLGAFIGMRAFGVSGNLMSLGAIDFGLIVDGAVIVIENAVRLIADRSHRLGRALTRDERSTEVLQASREVLRSAVFEVTIIAIVYLPVLSLTGIEGKMFRPMALTVLFALAVSLLLALTLIPVLASLFLPAALSEVESPIVGRTRAVYEPLLRRCLAAPRRTLGAAAGLFVLALGIAPWLGAEFIPRLDEGAIAVQAWRPPSVALEESVRQTTGLETVLRRFPEVTAVVSKTGRAEIATDPMGVEVSDVLVMLKSHDEWTTAATREELIAAMDSALTQHLPGTIFSYSQPIELRVSELISGVRSDVALKIFGDDLATLGRVAGGRAGPATGAGRGGCQGGADRRAARAPDPAGPASHRAPRAERVRCAGRGAHGRRPGGGRGARGPAPLQPPGTVRPETRASLARLADLTVLSPRGQRVPLAQLARIAVEDGPAQISHEGSKRFISVEMNVRGRDLAGFVADAQAAVEGAGIIPPGYFTEWGGQFKNLAEATQRLLIVVPVALLLIFVLLYASQGSAGLAGLIYLNVPFAISGIFALGLRGMPLSISAGGGFIALFGVAVLNGLVLLSYVRQRQDEEASAAAAAFDGARVRLRPVLTTALVASLGFVPMALASGAGPEVQKPLATVVIGGLVTSTILTLLVLPAVYAWLMSDRPSPTEKVSQS